MEGTILTVLIINKFSVNCETRAQNLNIQHPNLDFKIINILYMLQETVSVIES